MFIVYFKRGKIKEIQKLICTKMFSHFWLYIKYKVIEQEMYCFNMQI